MRKGPVPYWFVAFLLLFGYGVLNSNSTGVFLNGLLSILLGSLAVCAVGFVVSFALLNWSRTQTRTQATLSALKRYALSIAAALFEVNEKLHGR